MTRAPTIQAYVFDAYGTLFDTSSVARAAQDALGERWQVLAELWRNKQLQYTWLRSLAGHHADFWQVTRDALEFALDSLGIEETELSTSLMEQYLRLSVYPEVPDMLRNLRARGARTAILSNGTPRMLASAVEHAGIADCFDAVLSIEEVGVFKPHPAVYRLALERLGLEPGNICFISANSWDAWSAKAFGFTVLWCNRFAQAPERIPASPDATLTDLSTLPAWLG